MVLLAGLGLLLSRAAGQRLAFSGTQQVEGGDLVLVLNGG